MATHDYVISNASGASVRADLNNALAAIVSNNSNATSPATTYAYQWWADTTTGQLKLRNSANSAWITIFELDGTMLMEDGSLAAPGLAFASDLDTGFSRSAANKINFSTGGAERLEIGDSEVVFNDPSNDVDFRVESNGNSHMLFVDAGNDRIGIGTSAPATEVAIIGTDGSITFGNSHSDEHKLSWDEGSIILEADPANLNGSSSIQFKVDASERCRIDSSGRLLHGTSASVTANSETRNVQIATTVDNANQGLGIYAFTASNNAPRLDLGSSPNGSVNTFTTASSSGGLCGRINFLGSDGDEFLPTARIEGRVDGTAGNGDMPGRLEFYTTADSESSPTERVRIDSSGRLGVGLTPSSAASITNVDAGLIQTDGNIDIRYPGSNVNPAGARYLSFVNTDSTLVAGQPMGGIRWVGNDTSNTSRDTASILAFCSGNTGNRSQITFNNDGGTERLRLDSDGRLLVGTSTARTDFYSGSLDADIQLEDSSYCAYSAYATNGNAAFIFGRGNPVSGSVVGNLSWMADDGTDEVEAARISAQIDGTPGSNDMPGRLVFSTTADGAASTTEAMRISSAQHVAIGTTTVNRTFQVGKSGAETFELEPGESANNNLSLHFNRNTSAYIRNEVRAIDHTFLVQTVEKVRVDTNGLTFNGDTAAGNALNDYEEGTFTPTIQTTSTSGQQNMTAGFYTKIGRTVVAHATYSFPTSFSLADLTIRNLPFTSNSTGSGAGALFEWQDGAGFSAGVGRISGNSTTAERFGVIASPAGSHTGNIFFTFTYTT